MGKISKTKMLNQKCKYCGEQQQLIFEPRFGYIAGCGRCEAWTPWANDADDAIRLANMLNPCMRVS